MEFFRSSFCYFNRKLTILKSGIILVSYNIGLLFSIAYLENRLCIKKLE